MLVHMPAKQTVQGYTFNTVEGSDLFERNGSVCKIVGRVEEHGTLLERGPMFKIKFGDGLEADASADELNPWFPWE